MDVVLCLVTQLCLTLFDLIDYSPPGSTVLGDSPNNNCEVDYHALLQGISPTQGSNPGLLHCRQMLYCLSHQGSPHKTIDNIFNGENYTVYSKIEIRQKYLPSPLLFSIILEAVVSAISL